MRKAPMVRTTLGTEGEPPLTAEEYRWMESFSHSLSVSGLDEWEIPFVLVRALLLMREARLMESTLMTYAVVAQGRPVDVAIKNMTETAKFMRKKYYSDGR